MATILKTPRNLLELYCDREYAELSQQLLNSLDFFSHNSFLKLSTLEFDLVNSFIEIFLFIFCRKDYPIEDRFAKAFVRKNPLICNIVAMSAFKNTDSQLIILQSQSAPLVKILTLLSPRNCTPFNRSVFFNCNAELASLWYSLYYCCSGGFVSKLVYDNLCEHQAEFNHNWTLSNSEQSNKLYFLATYVNTNTDKVVKKHINNCIKPHFKNTQTYFTPNKRKIAMELQFSSLQNICSLHRSAIT